MSRTHTVDSARAWVVVAGAFLAAFTCFFVVYSFSTAFKAIAAEFPVSKSAIALMFGMVIFFLFVMGLPAGRVCDRIGPRPVMVVGAVSITIGLLLTSLIHGIVIGWVTYGVGVGFGVACCYVPLMAQVGAWFNRFRASALGIASAGIGLGTFVGPIVTAHLVKDHGWRTTFRLQAVGAAAILALATVLAARAPGTGTAKLPSLRETFAKPGFRRFYLSGLLLGLGLFVPFVFLVPYANAKGVAAGTAASLVSLLGIGSLSGRLLLSAVAGRLGLPRLYKLCIFVMGACFVVWLFAGSSFPAMAVFAVILGMSYGGYVALSPAMCAQMFGLVGLAGVLGALYTSSGVGGLAGPPAAGWLIDHFGYTWAILFALVLASLAVVALPPLSSMPEADVQPAGPRAQAATTVLSPQIVAQAGVVQRTRSANGIAVTGAAPNGAAGNGNGAGPHRTQPTLWPVGDTTEDAVPVISW